MRFDFVVSVSGIMLCDLSFVGLVCSMAEYRELAQPNRYTRGWDEAQTDKDHAEAYDQR